MRTAALLLAFCQASATCVLVVEGIDLPHKPFLMVFQLIASASLVWQWRTANPYMFLVRGWASWAIALLFTHSIPCGRNWYWEECNSGAWQTHFMRFRTLQCISMVRMLCNGLSLFCQFRFPHRMFCGHGNEQLFYRGCIQAAGIPLHLAYGSLKLNDMGTEYARTLPEVVVHFVRVPIIATAAWSLIDQWYTTGKNKTGHPLSDLYEQMSRAGKKPWAALTLARRQLLRARKGAAKRAQAAKRAAAAAGGDSEAMSSDANAAASFGVAAALLSGGCSTLEGCASILAVALAGAAYI